MKMSDIKLTRKPSTIAMAKGWQLFEDDALGVTLITDTKKPLADVVGMDDFVDIKSSIVYFATKQKTLINRAT